MVVSFSGIDGAGKTTQIKLLEEYCQNHNIKYIKKWSKARGTPGIMFLKNLVRRDKNMNKEEKLEHREQVFKSGWKKELLYIGSMLDLCCYWGIYFRILKKKYDLVILDRYIWDTCVEVTNEFNKPQLRNSFLWKLLKLVALVPEKQLLLSIPAEESLKRDILKGEITTDDISVKKEKVKCYEKLKAEGCWNVVVDAMETIENTHNKILVSIGYRD